MKQPTCEQIHELLVEFSDGELLGDEGVKVEAHLRDCPACRGELQLLGESLGHARALWHESVTGLSRFQVGRRRRVWPKRISAAVAVVVIAAGIWGATRIDWSPRRETPEPIAVDEHPALPDDSRLAFSDINSILANEAGAARLAASAELLATVPSLRQYSDRAEQYLRVNYADSRAGRRTRLRPTQTETPVRTGDEP